MLSMRPDMPKKSSMAPYMTTNHLALIGMGGMRSMMTALGCIMPNASSRPKTAPEAPTVGIFMYIM